MLIVIGLILSIGASIGTYYGFGFFDRSLWYLFLLIPFVITYFIIFLNIYWGIVLLGIRKYRDIEYPGKVNRYHLFNVRMVSSFVLTINGILAKKKEIKKWPKKPGLYIFNHVSDYDPWAIYKVMNGRYAFVGKKALRNIVMVRSLASSIGTLYVENGNKELNQLMNDHAVDYILHKDTSVVIAPEGTRSFTGEIHPFKIGAFLIAKQCKCPIYFLGISGMERAVKKSKARLVKTYIELFEALNPEDYESLSAAELALLCEKKYREHFKQL